MTVPLLFPAHTGAEDDKTPVGLWVTLMVEVAVFIHPLAPVTVTVYVVVAEGKAMTVFPVLIDKSPEGLHE